MLDELVRRYLALTKCDPHFLSLWLWALLSHVWVLLESPPHQCCPHSSGPQEWAWVGRQPDWNSRKQANAPWGEWAWESRSGPREVMTRVQSRESWVLSGTCCSVAVCHFPVPSPLWTSVSSPRPVCRIPWLSSCSERPTGL